MDLADRQSHFWWIHPQESYRAGGAESIDTLASSPAAEFSRETFYDWPLLSPSSLAAVLCPPLVTRPAA